VKRRRHAASRARKLTAALSILAFVGIGQAIEVAAQSASSAGSVAAAQATTSLPSTSQRSATGSAATQRSTRTAVTTTGAS